MAELRARRRVPAIPLSSQLAVRVVNKLRRTIYSDPRMIVISAMPKSGSTFLTLSIATLMGYRHTTFSCGWGNVDQELYLPKLVDAYGQGTVTQQHFKANQHNLELLAAYGLRPVVLVRNVFDALVSARDHLNRESLDNLPGISTDEKLRELDFERQMDFVVDVIAPWYIGYFTSWCKAETKGVPFLWMSYEEAIADWPGAVSRVLEYNGIQKPPGDVVAAVEAVTGKPRDKSRLNQGVAGRGRKLMSRAQQEKVVRLMRYYDVDFSRLGVESLDSVFTGD